MWLFVGTWFLLASAISSPSATLIEESSPARIVNGFEVDVTEVPYQAAVRRRISSGWAHICGAVVIHENAVLTAGHCVEMYIYQPNLIRIAVGTSYRLSGGKTYDIQRILVHEDYSSSTLQDDIAILFLQKQIDFNKSINLVSIAPQNFILPDGAEALVTGFGTTSFEGTSSPVLMAAKVNLVNQETCAQAYSSVASVSSRMICAHSVDPPRDACQGDSGGPLVAENFLIGIVSWGEGCADLTYPGVYTRVSEYYNWITENLEG